MNERIQQLAIEAGGGPSKWYTNPDVLEYFAELIVLECADFVQFYYKDHACEMIAHDMKINFGVEV